MGVLKTIVLVSSIILGAVSIRIDYVPLNPNYLPYFDPAFNPQENLLNSASTNYLIPKIQLTNTPENSGNKQPKTISKPTYPDLLQQPNPLVSNAAYFVSAQPFQVANPQQSIARNGEFFLDFGQRILDSKQNNVHNTINQVPTTVGYSGYDNSQNFGKQENLGYSNYQNFDKHENPEYSDYHENFGKKDVRPNLRNPAELNSAIYSIQPNFGKEENVQNYQSSEKQEEFTSPTNLDDDYFRNLEKQAERETEEKIRAAYAKKPGVYSSYASTVHNNNEQNLPATGKVETFQEVNLNNANRQYLKLKRGRKLEQVHHQDFNEADKKVPDVTTDTNDWEPISAPYEPHYHKEETSVDEGHGEIHYHQHKHIHNHAHHQDHEHIHDQEHKHVHVSSNNHGHSHVESHGHSHQGSHNHGHSHHQSHHHSHSENHGHYHKHQHQHIEAHKHGHQEVHKHDHGHQHDHGHDHQHTSNHQHGHEHGHKHSHHGVHSHGHKHGHKHSHDHGHKHSHSQEHKHSHEHDGQHKHDHGHSHGHKHSKH